MVVRKNARLTLTNVLDTLGPVLNHLVRKLDIR